MIPRYYFIPLFASLLLLTSCETAADVRNPTISDQDRLDVQWGLPKRESKGAAKRVTPSQLNLPATPSAQGSAVNAAPQAPAQLPTSGGAQPPSPTVDPAVINNLRN